MGCNCNSLHDVRFSRRSSVRKQRMRSNCSSEERAMASKVWIEFDGALVKLSLFRFRSPQGPGRLWAGRRRIARRFSVTCSIWLSRSAMFSSQFPRDFDQISLIANTSVGSRRSLLPNCSSLVPKNQLHIHAHPFRRVEHLQVRDTQRFPISRTLDAFTR
jgi:hypothetical protein